MTPLDAIAHAGYTSVFLGQFLLTRKNRGGWLLRIGGDLAWVGFGVTLDMSSIVLWSIAFAINDARGWWLWRRREEA